MPFRPLAVLLAVVSAWPAAARDGSDWTGRKCQLYADAWGVALEWKGTDGLGPAFLERHAAFLASGCAGAHDVCPRSPEELGMADLLTVMSMSEGMASTFVPFACPG